MPGQLTPNSGLFGPQQGGPGTFNPDTGESTNPYPRVGPKPTDPNEPPNYVDRLVGLSKTHQWMPHQTVATLAALPASDNAVASMAAALRKAYGGTNQALHYFTDDPLLQKDPSLALSLKMYLTSTVGPWPLADSDLVHVQKQLQAQGFGKGQKTDGLWNNQWNAAYGQYVSQAKSAALGGNQPGSSPVGSVLGALNSLLPREAASAVIGFAKAIPHQASHDLRTLAGNVGASANEFGQQFQQLQQGHYTSAVSDVGHSAQQFFTGRGANQQARSAAAHVENMIPGGPHVTPQTSFAGEGERQQLMDVASVVGDIFATHGLFGAGKTVAQAAGDTALTGLDREAAVRGPGAIAKSLYERTPNGVGGAIPSIPILRMTGPVADRMIGEEGLYYRARTLLAQPQAYGPVRLAGTAVGQLGVAGAKIRGTGAAEGLIGGQTSPTTQAINSYQGVNNLDAAIQNKLAFTVAGHHIHPGLDTLAWFLHPPLSGPGAVSESIGNDFAGAHEALNNALGPSTGFAVSIERGVNSAKVGKYMTYQDLVDHFGGQTNFNTFWTSKIMQHAAAHYADLQYSKAMASSDGARIVEEAGGRTEYLKQQAHEAYMDPQILKQSAMEMIANSNENPVKGKWGGPNELSKRIAKEILYSEDGRRGYLAGNGENLVKAWRTMRNTVLPRMGEVFADPIEKGTLGLASNSYKFKDVAETEAAEFESQYQDALQSVQNGDPGSLDNLNELTHQIRTWLQSNFTIANMPDDHQDLVNLAKKVAGQQSGRIFLREQPLRTAPERPDPSLSGDLANNTTPRLLHEATEGKPVYRTSNVQDAIDTLFETGAGRSIKDWHNSVRESGSGQVTIEMDPQKMFGALQHDQITGYDLLRGRASFQASRANMEHDLDGVRAVDIHANANAQGLESRLEAAGFKPISQGNNVTRWVREDLVGGVPGASPQLKQAFSDLHKAGYTPVMGRDIGHAFYEQPHIDIMDGALAETRRIVEKMGLSPETIPTHDLSFQFDLNLERELLDAVESGKLRLQPYDTVHGIVARLRQENVLPTSPGFSATLQRYGPGYWTYKANVENMTNDILPKLEQTAKDTGRKLSRTQARQEAEALAIRRLAANVDNPMGLLHITPGQVRKALGMKVDEDSALGQELRYQHGENYTPGPEYDEHSTQEIFRAIQAAKAKMPNRMTGLQSMEDLLTQKLGFAGRALPGKAGRWVENMPSFYTRMRNQFRFTLSPEYSLRRLVKSNVKLSLEGVPPTLSPLHAMESRGITKEALGLLDRVMPEWKDPSYDEGVQSLYSDDVFGLYQHRNMEAYAAWHWKRQGMTDTEIRSELVKTFGYGSEHFGEGRTAMERTGNFIFFPLSFDKTLYRNVGAYLLDRPAQRMVLTAGLAAYHQWNNAHPNGDTIGTASWFQKHVPLAQEALRLNAFAHGVGIGQFGGINAPVLNLFIPQSYNADSNSLQVVKGFVPIIREMQDFGQELGQTTQITEQELKNLGTGPGTVWKPQVVAETQTAQLYDAYTYRRQLMNSILGEYVHQNAHSRNKLKIPNDVSLYGKFAGQVVNATMINKLTNAKFPAFQIQEPSVYYANEAAAITTYSDAMRMGGHQDVSEWIGDAQKYGTYIYDGKLNPGAEKQATTVLRNYAVKFAETVPGFLTFYNTNFRWQYGPLEAVR